MNTDVNVEKIEEIPITGDEQENSLQESESTRPSQQSVVARMAGMLRIMGAIVLVASAAAYLVQGWYSWNSIERYSSFLMFTVSLAGFGLFSGLRLKDDKGARTFLAVATMFVTAHSAQLGGMVYSFFGTAPEGLPLGFVFQVGTSEALFAIGISALLLIPIVFLGFSALVKSEARELTLCYLAASVLLMLPVRTGAGAAIVALLLLALVVGLDLSRLLQAVAMKTPEGRISRALLFAPFAALLLRNSMHWDVFYSMSLMFSCSAVALFVYLPRLSPAWISAQVLTCVPLVLAWCNFVGGAYNSAPDFARSALGEALLIPLMMFPASAGLAVLSQYTEVHRRAFRRQAAVLAIFTAILHLLTYGGLIAAILCVATSVLVVVAAVSLEDRILLYSGSFGLAVGLIYHLKYAVKIYALLSPWLSLAIIGAVAVLTSSYLERNIRLVVAQSAAFRGKISSWK